MLHLHTWEPALLSQALEAWPSITVAAPRPLPDQLLLDRAYGHCARVTALHSRSFQCASSFLPHEKRRAVRALYAF